MKASILVLIQSGTHKTREALFTAKQVERVRALLEVAEQSADNERDADLLDRISRLFA